MARCEKCADTRMVKVWHHLRASTEIWRIIGVAGIVGCTEEPCPDCHGGHTHCCEGDRADDDDV